jgi:hypothetical protein
VKAASGALRNLAVDARNKELIGKELNKIGMSVSSTVPVIQQVLRNLFT